MMHLALQGAAVQQAHTGNRESFLHQPGVIINRSGARLHSPSNHFTASVHLLCRSLSWCACGQVDGRFRVACGLKALWPLAPSGKLVVHDWERVWYHEPLLRFYNILEVTATGQMVVLTPKTLSEQQWHQARTLLDEYSATAF